MSKTRSRWRAEANRIIAQTLAALPPDHPRSQVRAALRAAYPWQRREGHPYKVWSSAVRDAVGRRFAAEVVAPPDRPRIVLLVTRCRGKSGKILAPPLLGVDCPWCLPDRPGCLACGALHNRAALVRSAPEFEALRVAATDPLALSVLRDWLEEHGIETERGP